MRVEYDFNMVMADPDHYIWDILRPEDIKDEGVSSTNSIVASEEFGTVITFYEPGEFEVQARVIHMEQWASGLFVRAKPDWESIRYIGEAGTTCML